MGDPRKFRGKYSKPGHPWQKARIEAEKPILKEYGLRTKRELWKMDSNLKAFAKQAKRLIALRGTQAELEKKQLLSRLERLGLVKTGAGLDDVLAINLKNLLDRRLQTLVFKKGLAKTPLQARQFIIHEHVNVGSKVITSPSYIVKLAEEQQVTMTTNSPLANPEHPERRNAK